MPYIAIRSYPGRDEAKKKEIAVALGKALMETAGVAATTVTVTYEDIPKEEWDVTVKQGIVAKMEPEQVFIQSGSEDWAK